jgi:hypothetical protein
MAKPYKANSSNSKTKKRFFVLVFILCVSVIMLAFLEKTRRTDLITFKKKQTTTVPINNIDLSPATAEDKKAVEDAKVANVPNKVSESPSISPTTAIVVDPSVKISKVTYTATKSELVVQTELIGVNWTSCDLTINTSSGSKTYTVEVLFQEQFSTCLGYAIATTDIATKGEWKLQVTATKSDGSKLTSESETVNVQQ